MKYNISIDTDRAATIIRDYNALLLRALRVTELVTPYKCYVQSTVKSRLEIGSDENTVTLEWTECHRADYDECEETNQSVSFPKNLLAMSDAELREYDKNYKLKQRAMQLAASEERKQAEIARKLSAQQKREARDIKEYERLCKKFGRKVDA